MPTLTKPSDLDVAPEILAPVIAALLQPVRIHHAQADVIWVSENATEKSFIAHVVSLPRVRSFRGGATPRDSIKGRFGSQGHSSTGPSRDNWTRQHLQGSIQHGASTRTRSGDRRTRVPG